MQKRKRPIVRIVHWLALVIALITLVTLIVVTVEWIKNQKIKKAILHKNIHMKEGVEAMTERQWAFFLMRFDKSKEQINVRINGRWITFFGTLSATVSTLAIIALAPSPVQSLLLFFVSLLFAAIAAQAKHNDDRIAEQDRLTQEDEILVLGGGQSYNERRDARKGKSSSGMLRKFSSAITYVGIQGAVIVAGVNQLKQNLLQLIISREINTLQTLLILSAIFLVFTFIEIVNME